jgi:hypothetical protein
MSTDNIDIINNQVDLLCLTGMTYQAATHNGFIAPIDVDCMVDQVKASRYVKTKQPAFAGDLCYGPAQVSPAISGNYDRTQRKDLGYVRLSICSN